MAGGDESIYAVSEALLSPERAGRVDTVLIKSAPEFALLRNVYWKIKRPLGLGFALVASLLTLPAFLAITAVLASQGSPVFIRRQRLGQYGKPFTSYYFRTMTPHSVRSVAGAPVSDALGKLLRRTGLDHLPLLFNVLRGDMNIVGPRALSQEELMGSGRAARFSLSVRPGLTGLWLIDNERDLRRRLAADRSYIDAANPLLDLRIVARTVAQMHGV